MTSILGTPTINPFLFYSGKIAGYCVWCLFPLQFFISVRQTTLPVFAEYLSGAIFLIGLIIAGLSMLHLGKSTSLGLPEGETQFKNQGLYRFSRNPMYAGFGLLTIASVIQTANIAVFLAALYSLCIYHLIIRGEEKFLKNRFGTVYTDYCLKVRRYL